MNTVQTEFKIKDIVYAITGPEQSERIITAICITYNGCIEYKTN